VRLVRGMLEAVTATDAGLEQAATRRRPGGSVIRPLLVVAVLAIVVTVGLRDGWVRTSGLSGSCTQVTQNADETVLEACHQGWLEGWPSLASHDCTVVRKSGRLQYWHCPASLVASQVGR
jgi:hypothetical protein